ncbi:winged helix-turn-helix domain-containing protein [uncultured Enterococcus sp.]|uniref:winged helix-turn-helix domain-containing protein n=1 Tax=uncultured Enterococcus sp. TaxID=167972 RepID=UPI002AA8EE85|nr:winged helix-turn-helix domain-containing protein [uncultured Enterococcus sp.]
MYTLGINFKKEESLSGNGAFEFPDCQMISFTEENFLEQVQMADGILLRESKHQPIEKICYMIIELKKKWNPLIWVLTEQTSSIQKIIYLELGADGTFNYRNAFEEIQLVVKHSLARYCKMKEQKKVKETVNDALQLDGRNLSLKADSGYSDVILTRLEYHLLKIFLENQSVTLTYKQLNEIIWGYPDEHDRYRIANLVFHLRSKLKQAGKNPAIIRTVRAQGYTLEEDV